MIDIDRGLGLCQVLCRFGITMLFSAFQQAFVCICACSAGFFLQGSATSMGETLPYKNSNTP